MEQHNANNKQKNKTTQFILQDPEAELAANLILKRIDTFNPHREKMLMEITANICYLVGQQRIGLMGGTIVPLPKSRTTEVIENLILPAVQNDVSVGTSSPSVFDVVPAGTDLRDKATAIAGDKVLKYLRRVHGPDLKRAEAILWYDISTVGWRKTWVDPNYNVIGINPPPIDEQTGQPNPGHIEDLEVGAAITEPEVLVDCVPTNQLIWDYRQTDLYRLPWIIHCSRRSADWVMDRFGDEIYEKLKPQFNSGLADGTESRFEVNVMERFSSLFGEGSTGQSTFTPKMSSTAEMKLDSDKEIDYYELWQKPTDKMPTGMYAVMLGNQIVHHGPYPIEMYPHGELPFTPAAPLNIPGVNAGGISRISQARPIQRDYNKLLSMVDENVDVMGNAVVMSPRSCKVRHKTLDNGAGNLIEYDSVAGKPTRESGVPMNNQVFSYLQIKRMALDGIFSFHAPSRGIAPKNIESGKGLERLQNADYQQHGPVVSGFEKADERIAYQALSLAIANYPEGKLINVVGDDYQWTSFQLDKQELLGKYNVIVRRHSSMPQDKESEKIQAFQAWSSGLLGNPEDPEIRIWTLEQMSMGNSEQLLQRHSKHKNFAMKEFISAERNLKEADVPPDVSAEQLADLLEKYLYMPQVNHFDDHTIHLMAHTEYMMDNFWKFRSSGNPLYVELLNRMNMHIGQHREIINMMQQAQFKKNLQAEMLLKGKTMEQIALSKMNFDDDKSDKSETKKKGK